MSDYSDLGGVAVAHIDDLTKFAAEKNLPLEHVIQAVKHVHTAPAPTKEKNDMWIEPEPSVTPVPKTPPAPVDPGKLPESDRKTLTPQYLLEHENRFDPNVYDPYAPGRMSNMRHPQPSRT